MQVHRALLTSGEFAGLAGSIPGLELPRSFAMRRVRGGVSAGSPSVSPGDGGTARAPGGMPSGAEGTGADADALRNGLPAESLDSLRFLLMCHQFATVGVSVRAQTKATLLIAEYSVTYGLAAGLSRVQLTRFPQSAGVQLCALPADELPHEIVEGVRQLQTHDRADVGLTIIPRSKGRDKTWLAAHSVCCLFTWRRRHADQPDIAGIIADLCAEGSAEESAHEGADERPAARAGRATRIR